LEGGRGMSADREKRGYDDFVIMVVILLNRKEGEGEGC